MDSIWMLAVATLLAISVSGDQDDSDGWFTVSGDSMEVTNDELPPPLPWVNRQNVTTGLLPLNVSDVDKTTTEEPPVTMGNEDNTTIHVRWPTATIILENTTTGWPLVTEGDVENTTNAGLPITAGVVENTTTEWPPVTVGVVDNTTTEWPNVTASVVENTTIEWLPVTEGAVENTTIEWLPVTEGAVENTSSEWPPVTPGIVDNTTTEWSSVTVGDMESTTTERTTINVGDEENTTSGTPLVTSTLPPGDNVTQNDMPPLSQDEEIELLKIETETIKEEIKGINTDIGALDKDIKEVQQRMDDLYLETEWGEWGPFSSCSQTCVSLISDELGVQTRSRDCQFKTPPMKATTPICEGEAIETIDCKADNYCYELPAPKNESEYIGSDQGDYFSDENVWGGENITAIRVRCGDVAVSIQAMYGTTWGPIHGWNESCNDSSMAYDYPLGGISEYITMIDVKYGSFLETFQIGTNQRTIPTCGQDPYGIPAIASGTRLMYLEGKTTDCHLAGIQPIWSVE